MRRVIYNWEEVLEQQKHSGKSIKEFCREIEIHPNTFYKHRKRIFGCENTDHSSVVEIKTTSTSTAAPIVLQYHRAQKSKGL